MRNNQNNDKLITVKDGIIVCPICLRKTYQQITPRLTATALPVYCRYCKKQTIVDIANGQCSRSSCL